MKNKIIFYASLNLLLTSNGVICLEDFKIKELDYNIENLKDKNNIIEVAVIGSGPAGLSAALYASRGGFHTVLFKGLKPGGQLTDTSIVENWPGVDKIPGAQAVDNLLKQTEEFGSIISPNNIEKVDFSSWPFKLFDNKNNIYHALTTIIATGATPQKLNVEGENQYWGHGILSCGICDAPLTKNQTAVIVGAGDAAIERAMQIVPYAKKIIILARSDKMKASKCMQDKLKAFKQIKIFYNKEIKKIVGTKDHVSGIYIFDSKRKRNYFMKTDWIFLSIGFLPNTDIFKDQVDIDKNNYIKHDCNNQTTSVNGVFVAGNASDSIYKQAGTACGDGSKAGLNAVEFLSKLNFDSTLKPLVKDFLYKEDNYKKIETDVINIKKEEEFTTIINKEKPTVALFYSAYCSTCTNLQSTFDQLAKEFKDKIDFIKVVREELNQVHQKEKITVVPTIIIFKNSKEMARKESDIKEDDIKKLINQNYLGE